MGLDYKELGKRVARRRKSLNYTQDNVAEMTGLTNNHISNIENNHSIPSIDALMKIAIALDTSPDYFLLGTAKFGEDETFEIISQKVKLCDEKQKDLLNSFLDWLVEHKL